MDDDTEGRNGPRRQKLLHLTRDDLAQIPAKQARELLAQYEPLLRGFVRRFPRGLFCAQFDEEDLYALGQVMLLQAWLSYRQDAAQGGSFRGWATFLLRQRWAQLAKNLLADREEAATPFLVVEVVSAAAERDPANAGPGGSLLGRAQWVLENLGETPETEDELDRHQRLVLIHQALEDLTPRLRFIVRAVLEGRTSAQIASDLGVNRQRVDQLREEAYAELRRAVHRRMAADIEAGLAPLAPPEDQEEDEPRPATLRAWPATRSASPSSPS